MVAVSDQGTLYSMDSRKCLSMAPNTGDLEGVSKSDSTKGDPWPRGQDVPRLAIGPATSEPLSTRTLQGLRQGSK